VGARSGPADCTKHFPVSDFAAAIHEPARTATLSCLGPADTTVGPRKVRDGSSAAMPAESTPVNPAAEAASSAMRSELLATVSCPRPRAPRKVGIAIASKMAMTRTTTISSIRVKAPSGRRSDQRLPAPASESGSALTLDYRPIETWRKPPDHLFQGCGVGVFGDAGSNHRQGRQTAIAARTSSSEFSPPPPVPVMRPDSSTQ
jgi:hypothetical protein